MTIATPCRALLLGLAAALACLGTGGRAVAAAEPDHVLSRGFTVYSDDRTVSRAPGGGLTARRVPVWNHYQGPGGGYVACYTKDVARGAYRVAPDIAVVGLVRLEGRYQGRIFQPKGREGQDISALDDFKTRCGEALKACRGGRCWAGGDTGGFVGE